MVKSGNSNTSHAIRAPPEVRLPHLARNLTANLATSGRPEKAAARSTDECDLRALPGRHANRALLAVGAFAPNVNPAVGIRKFYLRLGRKLLHVKTLRDSANVASRSVAVSRLGENQSPSSHSLRGRKSMAATNLASGTLRRRIQFPVAVPMKSSGHCPRPGSRQLLRRGLTKRWTSRFYRVTQLVCRLRSHLARSINSLSPVKLAKSATSITPRDCFAGRKSPRLGNRNSYFTRHLARVQRPFKDPSHPLGTRLAYALPPSEADAADPTAKQLIRAAAIL
jgi:hypothetical protein